MIYSPPRFRSPLFPKTFLTPWKISQIVPFPENFSDFRPPKFYFSPTFPLLIKTPSVFGKFTCFLHTLRVFCPPYFYHDAFMHHTMHVLDAPAVCLSLSAWVLPPFHP